jgi:hypothetical protein
VNFHEYVTMRLGGEAKVREMVAQRTLRQPLEGLMSDLGLEVAQVLLLLLPDSDPAFDRFLDRLISTYQEGRLNAGTVKQVM